jgi:lyso-ornithine lipid O-acyltransferase
VLFQLVGWLRALWRLILVVGVTGVCVIRLTLACLVEGRTEKRVSHHARQWAAALVRMLLIDVRCHGVFPETGALIVANHRSYLDIVVVLSRVDAAFLAKKELRTWPVFGYAAAKGNTVFVDRSDAVSRRRSRQAVFDRLEKGISVVVFPEGTTYEGPGLLDFKAGIFHTAALLESPVVPAAVFYPDRSMAWVGDDTFVSHFLTAFSQPRIPASLYVGTPMSDSDGTALCRMCHRAIAQALAAWEKPDISTGQPLSCQDRFFSAAKPADQVHQRKHHDDQQDDPPLQGKCPAPGPNRIHIGSHTGHGSDDGPQENGIRLPGLFRQ